MPEFLHLMPPQLALDRLIENIPPKSIPLGFGECLTRQALGRVTYASIQAPYSLPSFRRSSVDGYAVRARETYGASEGLPAYLTIIGEVPMGSEPGFKLGSGQCALIHTGGMLPEEADAVVMVEYIQVLRSGEVEILRATPVGENVIKVGEDVEKGEVVITAGVRLRPAEIGGLMALGITHLPVTRKPVVGILSSGDEVVSPENEIRPGQVRDINTYTLSALVVENGGDVQAYGIISDQVESLYAAALKAFKECDLVVITAGSSASSRDLTAEVINRLGKPGVLVHGINIRPGKPTILAVCDGKVVIGLPGNPVSALVIAWLFVVPVLSSLSGLHHLRPKPSTLARLTTNVPSQAGREDWVAVHLLRSASGYQAEPVYGKSNLIFTLARADGLIRIPLDTTGLSAGEMVEVVLL
jgi:molybdopterin molybdotransferase